MDSGMENMLAAYLYETGSLLDQFDQILVLTEETGEFSSDDVNEIFRIMHTIKGSSAMMEFEALATISHHIEDLFFYIRDKDIGFLDNVQKKELFTLMFRSEDYLRKELERVENGQSPSANIDSFYSEIDSFLDKLGNPYCTARTHATNTVITEAFDLPNDKEYSCLINIFLEYGISMENLRAFMIVNSLKESDLDFRYYPEDIETNPDTCTFIADKGFLLAFRSLDIAVKAEGILKSQNYIRSYEIMDLSTCSEGKEDSINEISQDEPDLTLTAALNATIASPSQAPIKQNLISVSLMKLNSLMDVVGEIVITESMVIASPELNHLPRDSFDNFMKSARQLRKLTDDLQDISMSLRMVPISAIFQKMNRVVRDMKQKLGKDVRLNIIGEDTEVDRTIIDSIQDPIMHIVRNCMDHGFEEHDERIAAGKNPQGELMLSASHNSSEVIISVADDGRGMDTAKLLAKAKAKGILTKPESEYSAKEALALIMYPGFSTNQSVTEFSGRGVGMDVVKRNVENVGGTVTINSEPGQGTEVTMKIPLTLAIVDGMKVTVGGSIFTIPIANIRQSFRIKANQVIHDEYGNEMVAHMGSFYPIIRLHRFYGLETEISELENGILLWVESGENSYCLFVDDLVGVQQVVVKPLPSFLNNFNLKNQGIIGCTVLGDGNISIIIDILSLHATAIENT